MIQQNDSPLGAVILAAGLSSRMGQLKALLEIGGKTMITRIFEMMECAGASPIVVVTGHRHEEIEAHLRGKPVEFVYNPNYAATQMMDSLLLGLSALEGRCSRVLISPTDVPLVSPETPRTLASQEGAFLRPTYRGKSGHPVLLDLSILQSLLQYRQLGLKNAILQAGIPILDVPVPDPGILVESNTPEEFARVLAYQSQNHTSRR